MPVYNLHKASPESPRADTETPEESTSWDAVTGKCSAVVTGYANDPYVLEMVDSIPKLDPEISRGYYVRMNTVRKTVELLMETMLKKHGQLPQIVVLGAGFDSLYFLLREKYPNVKMFDIDFLAVLRRKYNKIISSKLLRQNVVLSAPIDELPQFENYKLVPHDLREWGSFFAKMEKYGFTFKHPVIYISECLFFYLKDSTCDTIIQECSKCGTNVGFVVYDLLGLSDAFEQTLIENLRKYRNIYTAKHNYPTVKSEAERWISRGWSVAAATSLNQIYEERHDPHRLNAVEWLDEVEGLRLMQKHYYIAVAVKCNQDDKKDYGHLLESLLAPKTKSINLVFSEQLK